VKFTNTQEDGYAIKKKLDAEVVAKKDHDFVIFRHLGKMVVSFGIRRGSKELPHPHIHLQMFLTQKECRLFRQCDISVLQYIEILKSRGKIEKPADTKAAPAKPPSSN